MSLPHIDAPSRQQLMSSSIPDDLGKLIHADNESFHKLGWEQFIRSKRGRGNFTSLSKLRHPAKRIINQYSKRGVPVVMHSAPWTNEWLDSAIQGGPHKSVYDYTSFLREEFPDMIPKGQWTVLPYSSIKNLPGLRLSPPGCVPQRDRRPRWICDYTFHGVNDDTADIVPRESMQFGRALDRILRHILLADPTLGPVYMYKLDISDGFYRIWLRLEDIPKLGVVFPHQDGEDPLVAFPLVLPMGWKNSPPAFSAVTETIADVANRRLKNFNKNPNKNIRPHQYDNRSEAVSCEQATPNHNIPIIPRDCHIAPKPSPLAYVDVYVDDFINLAQGSTKHRRNVRKILFHALDEVLRPLDSNDDKSRRQPISLKKLDKGDCSWSTKKHVLGWILDTVNMTIELPPHRIERLQEILHSIPKTQRRVSVKKWHKILGELRSMSIALPGARGLFSHLQQALATTTKHRLNLHQGVHDDLELFQHLHDSISSRPTRIAELVPLTPSLYGPHDASGQGAGGAIFPDGTILPRFKSTSLHHQRVPVVWRWEFPASIRSKLVTRDNPKGTISNSDFELAGELLEREAIVQCFDVRERTILTATDNTPTLFWSRKGSTTTTKAPAYLLKALAFHQRHHRYVPREDHIDGVDNLPGDKASRLFHLSDTEFLQYFNTTFPQAEPWHLWTPSQEFTSAVTSALLSKKSSMALLLNDPEPTITCGTDGVPTVNHWAWTPFSQISKTPSQSSKSLQDACAQENWHRVGTKFATAPLKVTYVRLGKRLPLWGAWTHGKRGKAT